MNKLRVLDLFSGIGGFSLGLERTGGFETVAFCEIEDFPRRVLAKHWPSIPCFEDVRKLTRDDIDGPVDVICGGYPCQPFSTAGRRKGEEDDRHLWPEVNRLLDEFRPTWFIGENVAGHISMGLDSVLSDLDGQGYTARPFVIPACAVDAKHRRDRVWIVAYSQGKRCGARLRETGAEQDRNKPSDRSSPLADANSKRYGANDGLRENPGAQRSSQGEGHQRQRLRSFSGRSGEVMADTIGFRQQGQGEPIFAGSQAQAGEREADNVVSICQPRKWSPEPDVGRVAHGVPDRSHRLKALGNSVVPQIPEMIGYAILQAEKERNAA